MLILFCVGAVGMSVSFPPRSFVVLKDLHTDEVRVSEEKNNCGAL